MVTRNQMAEYEALQLRLIASEYKSKGFEVDLNVHFPMRGSGSLIFDAVAKKLSEQRIVFIELLNPNRANGDNERRAKDFERVAVEYPYAEVDFRYLDTQAAQYLLQLERGTRRVTANELKSLLSTRIPQAPKGDVLSTARLLELWSLHALTMRAFAAYIAAPAAEPANLLDLYNSLLSSEMLAKPEQLVDDVVFDFFEIHEAVISATQGALVERQYLEQLREHIKSVRKQVRRRLKSRFDFD